MILDFFCQFTGTVAGAGDTPTVTGVSTNQLDLHGANLIPVLANLQGARDMGIGDKPAIKIVAWVSAVFAGGTSLQITLQGATDNGAGAPNAFVSWWSSPVYVTATLVAGARLFDMDMPRPPAGVAVPRFLQLAYTIVGTMSGGGTIKAWLVIDRMDQMYQSTNNAIMGGYPAGVIVAN
jgi:hypothetical protein